jgi:exopolysaccharide production protein ExoZ
MNRTHENKLYSLQYMRAIAAIGVVLVHASTTLEGREGARLLFTPGSYGVDLFFVISGFVMFYTTAEKAITPAFFFLRRCIRILPIYYILTTLGFALALFAPGLIKAFTAAPNDYLRSLLFVPYFNNFYQDIRPEVQQGWTLNFEMFFYVVFALCLWLKPRIRTWVCAGVFMALALIGILAAPAGVYAKTYTNPIILEFVFGVIIAHMLMLHESRFAKFALVSLAAACLAVACTFLPGISHRVLFAGVPAAAFVSLAILLEQRGRVPYWPFFVLVGDASYSLYLFHTFVLSALKRVFLRVFDGNLATSQLIFMVVGTVASILVSLVFYRGVEHPITQWLQALTRKKRSSQSSLQVAGR